MSKRASEDLPPDADSKWVKWKCLHYMGRDWPMQRITEEVGLSWQQRFKSPMMSPFGTEVQSQGPCSLQRCCKEMCRPTALAEI